MLPYLIFFLMLPRQPISTLFPYTTLFRSYFKNSQDVLGTFYTDLMGSWQVAGNIFDNVTWTSPGTENRSEEHTSELQSRVDLVCRLLLEKKKKTNKERPVRIRYIK